MSNVVQDYFYDNFFCYKDFCAIGEEWQNNSANILITLKSFLNIIAYELSEVRGNDRSIIYDEILDSRDTIESLLFNSDYNNAEEDIRDLLQLLVVKSDSNESFISKVSDFIKGVIRLFCIIFPFAVIFLT